MTEAEKVLTQVIYEFQPSAKITGDIEWDTCIEAMKRFAKAKSENQEEISKEHLLDVGQTELLARARAIEIFEKHWTKATGKPLDETTKNHMKYAIEAINEALLLGALSWWNSMTFEEQFYKTIAWLKSQNRNTTERHPNHLTDIEIRQIYEQRCF